MFLSAVPISAQANYPSRQEIRAALKDVDYALRRFEEVSGKINFTRWNAPYARVEASQKYLDRVLSGNRNAREWMSDLENPEKGVSSLALLRTLERLNAIAEAGDGLACDVIEYSKDLGLAIELRDTGTLAVKAAEKFRPFLVQQLEAQERELSLYRSANKPRQ